MHLSVLSMLIAILVTFAIAHTWPEELQVIGPNGTYIGDRGYSRGYIARTDPTFDGDANILWLLPSLEARMPDNTVRLRINSSDYLCHPSQRTSNYSNPEYPKLKVPPGGSFAIKYLENGHVTLPWNQAGKPFLGGTVFVYGTRNPSTTEKIANVLEWNQAGTGGDKRGWLITGQTFDDGRCHQINDCVNSAIRQALYPNMIPDQPTAPSQEQWCETDVTLPKNTAMGDLTLYWVWQWPTSPNDDCSYPTGKDEYYTSCIDVEIVDGGADEINIKTEYAGNTLLQENYQTKAVSTYKSRIALTHSPSFTLDNWGSSTSAMTPQAKFTSTCASVLSSIAANAGVPPPSCPSGLWATGALFASISSSVLGSHNSAVFLAAGLSSPYPTAPIITGVPAPGSSATSQQPRITHTAVLTTHKIKTITAVVTVTAGASPAPAAVSGSPSNVNSYPSGQEPKFNTISTVRASPSPAPAPEDVVERPNSIPLAEQSAGQRRHARQFL